jgi:hypothetical protein
VNADDRAPGAGWLRALAEPQRVQRWQLADWDRAVRLLRSHRLLARLGHAVQRTGLDDAVPAPARAHLVAAMRLSANRIQAVRWTAERLTPILAGVPGPKVLLKGAAYLALDLPIAAGRLPSDLDILVPRAHLDEAQSRLRDIGWVEPALDEHDRRYYLQWSHELPPMQHAEHSVELDVHHHILPPRDGRMIDMAPLLEAVRPSGWPGWSVLAPTDQVLHGTAHLFFDAEPRDRVRDLVDLDGLLRVHGHEASFWSMLTSRADRLDLAEPLVLGLGFAIDWLGTSVPPSTHDWLRETTARRPGLRLLRPLMARVLTPTDPDHMDPLVKRWAATAVLARYHWHRLPFTVLMPHLWRKWRSAAAADVRSEVPPGVNAP